MTAQPLSPTSRGWSPDPARQRRGDYTIEDVLNLPPDAPRVELVDGVIFVVPSPTISHQNIGNLLWMWFRQHAPASFAVTTAVGIAIDVDETIEPDVLLIDRDVDQGKHYMSPGDVVIAVEIVSPSTRKRDRFIKPTLYANAGIKYFWRIEQNPIHVFAYRLKDTGDYELIADSTELLELTEPFEITLPISDITP